MKHKTYKVFASSHDLNLCLIVHARYILQNLSLTWGHFNQQERALEPKAKVTEITWIFRFSEHNVSNFWNYLWLRQFINWINLTQYVHARILHCINAHIIFPEIAGKFRAVILPRDTGSGTAGNGGSKVTNCKPHFRCDRWRSLVRSHSVNIAVPHPGPAGVDSVKLSFQCSFETYVKSEKTFLHAINYDRSILDLSSLINCELL